MYRLKIGIIGAGYMGTVHQTVLARDERVRVSAVYDQAFGRAEKMAAASGATAARSVGELIEAVDAVYITTPNTKHTELAIEASGAGKHVFCEKPMATSLEEARAVLNRAESSDAVFQVGHNRRFAPVYRALRETLAEAAPHSAHIKMNRGELLEPGWIADPSITGGFLYETTVHMFDLARFLFGEVARMDAVGSTHEYPEPDDFSALLVFRNGMHATLASSADAGWMFPFERVEVFSHHSTIITREMESITASGQLKTSHSIDSMHRLSKEEKWGYAQEDRAFVDSVLNGLAPAVTALDGYKAVELVESCYRAVRTGERIEF